MSTTIPNEQRRDKIFFSYSHADEEWLDKLTTVLHPAVKNRTISPWSDKQISPGKRWKEAIRDALASAKVAVLLVSPDFLKSDFISDHELPDLLHAAETEGLTILWVAVSHSLVDQTEISHYQAAHDPSKPLDSLSRSDLNRELVKIARKIEQAAKADTKDHPIGLGGDQWIAAPLRTDPSPTFETSDFITGAQASLHIRAKNAFEQSAALLNRLRPLDPEANEHDIALLKDSILTSMARVTSELAKPLGPSVSVVSQCFQSLLGQETPPPSGVVLEIDPERIGGSLGNLRDECGLWVYDGVFIETVEDERNATYFRVLADYVISLAQSWGFNAQFFGPTTNKPTFGLQLLFLSDVLSAAVESLERLRSTLNSESIGPAKRRTLLIAFPVQPDGKHLSAGGPIFLEELLTRVEHFVSAEGPKLLRTGSRSVLSTSFLPELKTLRDLVQAAARPANSRDLPPGYQAENVQEAFLELAGDLEALLMLARVVAPIIPNVRPDALSPPT